MTKRPKTSRPIEINPDVMPMFRWTVVRAAGSPLIISGGHSLKLIVTAGGGLDFQDDVTVPTGGVVHLTIYAVPPGGYSYVRFDLT